MYRALFEDFGAACVGKIWRGEELSDGELFAFRALLDARVQIVQRHRFTLISIEFGISAKRLSHAVIFVRKYWRKRAQQLGRKFGALCFGQLKRRLFYFLQ